MYYCEFVCDHTFNRCGFENKEQLEKHMVAVNGRPCEITKVQMKPAKIKWWANGKQNDIVAEAAIYKGFFFAIGNGICKHSQCKATEFNEKIYVQVYPNGYDVIFS